MGESMMPALEDLSRSWDEALAEEALATRMRADARLPGPPTRLELLLAAALLHMVNWAKSGKFKPTNEEDVQCFLYHSLILEMGSATALRAKSTLGKLTDGDMHFPDLILGEDPESPEAIYIEIKFNAPSRKLFHGLCISDVKKLAQHHGKHRQLFIVWDCDPDKVYLSTQQKQQLLGAAATGCSIWHYPEDLDNSPGKARSQKAIETMRRNGLDLSALAKKNANKGKRGRHSSRADRLPLTDEQIDAINERLEATAGICYLCAHQTDGDPYNCAAFPDGIPISILTGMISHEMHAEGDHG